MPLQGLPSGLAPPSGLPPGAGPLQPDPNSPAPWPPQPPDGTPVDGTVGIFDLSVGKYDLVVDVGPSYTTRRAETADQMMQLIQAYPPVAPIIGDLIAKNLDWPGAQEIADRLKTLLPPQLQKGPDGQPIPLPPPPPSPELAAVLARNQREAMEAQMADKREQQRLLADNLTKLIVAKIQAGADIETARIKGGLDMHTTLAESLMQIFADAQAQQVQNAADLAAQQLQPPAAARPAGPGAMSLSSVAPGPAGNGAMMPPGGPPNGGM